MKIKLTYRRGDTSASDVVVTTESTATAGDVAREFLRLDPKSAREPVRDGRTLRVRSRSGAVSVLAADRALGEAVIASGDEVEIVGAQLHAPGAAGALPK